MLASQTPGEIVGKRLFEMAAAAKMMIDTLDALPIFVIGGLLLLVGLRDRERLITLSPVLILLLGAFVAYTVLIPYKAQAGSYKKFYLALVPLLLPLAAFALEHAVQNHRVRRGACRRDEVRTRARTGASESFVTSPAPTRSPSASRAVASS